MFNSSITFKCSEENAKEILNNILKIKEGFDKRTYTIETRSPEEEKEILNYLKNLESEGVEISSIQGSCCSTKKPYEAPSFINHEYTFEDLIWICQKAIDLRIKSSSFIFSDAVYFNFILTPALSREGSIVDPFQFVVGVGILKSRYGTEDKIDLNDFITRLREVLWNKSKSIKDVPNNVLDLLGLMYEENIADMGAESKI